MEYWGLEAVTDAEPPSPAAIAFEVGNSFLKRNWPVLVFGGAVVACFLMCQGWNYRKEVRARKKREREDAEEQSLVERARGGDVAAIEMLQQRNQNAAADRHQSEAARLAILQNDMETPNCWCM